MSVRVFDLIEALSEAAAAHVLQRMQASSGPFHLVLSGGSTPKRLYTILASPMYRDQAPWGRTHFWWGDERFVPPYQPESNEGMARQAMLNSVEVPASNVHGMFREGSAEDAAKAYESELRNVLGERRLDLVLLGLGPDAHTASLFPGDPSVLEASRWVVASAGAAGVKQRLTMTPPILNRTDEVLFLAAGSDKAEPLSHVFNEAYDPSRFPAQVIARNAPSVSWFIDEAAAARL